MAEKPPLPRMDSMPPVSARDASYWLAVASAPSSSRSGAATIVSASSSTRSLDASSFLLSIRSNSSSSSFLDVASGRQSSNKSLLELRSLSALHTPQQNEAEKAPQPLESDVVPPPPSSLYDSNLFAPKTSRRRTRKQSQQASSSSVHTESKRPVIVAEEVFEHQRYQMVLGWGSKGHLLPLDPDKYMRMVRHSAQRRRRRSHSRAQEQEEEEDVLLEWFPSSTFPDISLPEPPAADRGGPSTLKQRSRSATSASRPVTDARHHVAPTAATSVSGKSLVGPRWEWASPWHLEVPIDSPSDAVDGWQYASSFSHFSPRPSLRTRGRSIDSLSQSSSQSGGELPSSLPASSSGKRLRVRRRKWVRYRRLRSGRSSISSGTSSSAFDDAFLDSMSGWLRKRGHVRKNWKARYFVLERSVLRYYTDSSCSKLKGEVLLFHPQTRVHYVDVHVAGGRDASFAIQVGPEYMLLLQAAQLRDRENWMYCIEDALLCRDSYHPQGMTIGPGPYCDLRESVAQRRLLSAEAMALDGNSFQDNLGGISHAHGGAVTDDLSDEEDYDDQSESSSSHGQRRSSSNGGDVLRLWASLHAKPGGVLSAVSFASPTLRSLLRTCDQFLASLTMRQHIASFLVMFRQKYEQPSGSSVTAMGASAWTRLSEPWAPGVGGNESDSDHEIREGSLGASPQELQNITTLQDARSLLALKNYRFFLERSLELIMEHLAGMANPSTPRQLGDPALNGKRAPTDDEWALARRAALYKLERRTFIPLQEIIYQLLGAGVGPARGLRQEEEERFERFERLRALVAAQPQSFLEIQASHQSPSEWKSAIALLNSMDNYSLPSEKAAVLVEVARCIYETHAREHGFKANSKESSRQPTPMAADDFLPIFIFVLARCRLRSVIVARHLISETMITALMIGETGYYATMLEAAIGYIAAFDGAAKADKMTHRNSGSGSTAFSSF